MEVPPDTPDSLRHFRKVSQKHVDFVICDVDTLRPLAAVELDDRSHDTAKAKRADAEKDAALAAAGLPLVRFRSAGRYRLDVVKGRLDDAIAAGPARLTRPSRSRYSRR